ncbi:MAG TPA: HdeD family acid-resistance protein [Xanthobacteraceae bacterium]|nr:HdeD family acid-resistance protein [Xanthobacteraceae bacterium]
MSMGSGDANELQRALAQSIREHWVLFLIEGIVLVVLGVLAIIIPPIATIAVTIFLGWLFLISGIVGLVTTFWARHAPGFWWSLLSAMVAIAAGVVLLGWPVPGAVSLTLLLIVFFIIEGVLSIMYALEHKKELSGRWGWMLISGIIDLILAAIIWGGLPGTAAWALGLLVGINMLFGGSAMIAMALHARHADPTTSATPKAL